MMIDYAYAYRTSSSRENSPTSRLITKTQTPTARAASISFVPALARARASRGPVAMASPDDSAAATRMRRRAFLNEARRLRKRQSGITPRHDTILGGVYELEPKPDWRTEARLAAQLDLDAVAVATWFRNRRVRDKRANARAVGTVMFLVAFVVLACVYLWELNGLEALMQRRRDTAPPNRRHMTKSGLPRPYKTKAPFEEKYAKPRDPPSAQRPSGGAGAGTGTKGGAGTGKVRTGTTGTKSAGTGTKTTTSGGFFSTQDRAGGTVRRGTPPR